MAVARALADAGVATYALDANPKIPGAATNRVRQIFRVAELSGEGLIASLVELRARLPQDREIVLMPINDRQVETIARHLDRLVALYRISWADRAETIVKLQRKDLLERLSLDRGLAYPRSQIVGADTPADFAAGFRFPVILKPVRPLSRFKTLLAADRQALEGLLRECAADLPVLCQEYIEGDDTAIYFGVLMLDRGRVLHGMTGRKLKSFPLARGQATVCETVDEPEVLRLTEQFFDGMGLSGPVSLETKRDTRGRHWTIEPTIGRTDFWVDVCIRAGFNLPLMEYELAAGLPVTPPAPQTPCVWYDTERDALAYAELCWREKTLRPRGKRQAFPYFGSGDWRPVLRATLQSCGRIAAGVAKRARLQSLFRPSPAP
ncbi:hypothetical protein [Rubrivivax sp. A210]|uniref:carboxylate--amine ligase n=1 Tax=Rubrivivax sp. A210 TaxID=2772301 RepID=UPI0019183D63|nr:hypothetical protein [Rubrivivax sp. A210]